VEPDRTSTSPLDSRIIAALRLGFHSRYFGSDFLGDCLAALTDEISPNAYVGLAKTIAQIDQAYIERTAANPRQAWKPSQFDIRALCRLADNAIAPSNPLRCWYDVGARLGDCELKRPKGTLDEADLERFGCCLRALPLGCCDEIFAVQKFLDTATAHRSTINSLRKAIKYGCSVNASQAALPEKSKPQSPKRAAKQLLTDNPDKSVLVDLLDAFILGVSRLTLDLLDDRQDTRDRWLYEQARAGIPHKTVVAKLKGFPRWDQIAAVSGITAAVKRFAKRHHLPLPVLRRAGRPSSRM